MSIYTITQVHIMHCTDEIAPRLLNERQAADYICMSRSFLAQARMDGPREGRTTAPAFIKVGRSVRYLREDLDTWIDGFIRFESNEQYVPLRVIPTELP